jgi:hypothetical protein
MAKDAMDEEHETLTHQLHAPDAGYERCTRVELEQRAGEKGIPGHSGMSKEQLIEELLRLGAPSAA